MILLRSRYLKFLIIITLMTAFSVIFWYSHSSHYINQTPPPIETVEYELLASVDDVDEAHQLSATYGMELVEISQYNIASYRVHDAETYMYILSNNTDGIEANSIYRQAARPQPNPTDPYLNQQYALTMMEVNNAWSIGLGTSNVIVAIIDTGIDTDHTDLSGKISSLSYNSSLKQVGLAYVEDVNGHGTSVAGIIAAKKDNSFGIAGIAPGVTIMAIKANAGSDDTFYDSAVIEGIYYAANNGAHIINLSLGGYYRNSLMEQAINYAFNKGVIVVAASGNDGISDLVYPASFPNVISVSAVTSTKAIASYSNYGSMIDVAAPGTSIYTTGINNTIVISSGTSVAAPQVTGVIALLRSFYYEMESIDIINKIYQYAMDMGDVGRDDYYGYGIVNAYDSLSLPVYTVTFLDAFDSVIKTESVTYQQAATAPSNPQREADAQYSYIFSHWDTEYTSVVSNLVIRPIFTAILNQYIYTFYDEDGTTILKQALIAYGEAIIPPEEPSKSSTSMYSYHFSGWSPSFISGTSITQSVEYVAVYTRTLNHYTYTFYDEDGKTVLKEETAPYGSLIVPPTDPIKPSTDQYSYTFAGWDKAFDLLESDMVMYAIYDATLNQYQVRIHIESDIHLVSIVYGESVIFPDIPSELEDAFIGWSNDGSNITNDIDIYALFNFNTHTLRFYIEEVLFDEYLLMEGESLNDLPPLEEREGYTAQWSVEFIESVYEDLNIYALYTPIQYTITFMNANGRIWLVQSVDYGETIAPLSLESTGGVRLKGWLYEEELYDFSNIVTQDMTLIAVYEPIPTLFGRIFLTTTIILIVMGIIFIRIRP